MKFLRTADAFRPRRREGPYRFTQKQPPAFVSALRSVAAVDTAKNHLSRDFRCGSIFDFFNSIRHERTFDIYHASSNALINLAIKDAIAREESSCRKCFPETTS